MSSTGRLCPSLPGCDRGRSASDMLRSRMPDAPWIASLSPPATPESPQVGGRPRFGNRRHLYVIGLAIVAVLAGILAVVLTGGGLGLPTTTSFQAATPFTPAIASSTSRSGNWTLHTIGPPNGGLACGNPTACYVLAGKYASAKANAPVLSVALYSTHDIGTTWSETPMPRSFVPGTGLSCPAPSVCAVGGKFGGHPAFLLTTDAGSRWTIKPLMGVPGEVTGLLCSSATSCNGLAGPISGSSVSPPDEAFVSTTDTGRTWRSHSFPAADDVENFTCADATHCVVAGTKTRVVVAAGVRGRSPVNNGGFVRFTSNDGASWTDSDLPDSLAQDVGAITCADDSHCLASVGIVGTDGVIESDEAISTTNGGRSWGIDPLPSNLDYPEISWISCPSTTECWAAGMEGVSQEPGVVSDSAVLFGTTDGGTTWSNVVFTVPPGAPNPYDQSYYSMGEVDCPSVSACIAMGSTAQGAPNSPIYSFVSPSSQQ